MERMSQISKPLQTILTPFFTEIGPRLARKFNPSRDLNFKDYLKNPSRHRFTFKPVTEIMIDKIIDSFKPKTSCSQDGISVKLLKLMKSDLVKSITLVVNQSLATGIFPENLKIAKVIPIFKKDDENMFDNYRPISILPAVSKIF